MVSMVTQQAGDDELQKADTVAAREGTVNGSVSNPLDETILASRDNEHEIEAEIAMRRNHCTEQGEQDNRLTPLDAKIADNGSGLNRPRKHKDPKRISCPR